MSENNALVIFGSTGDLTFQKLLPSLARLNHLSSHLIQKIFLIGRQGKTLEEYITYGIDHGLDAKLILPLMDKLHYVFMQASEKDSYATLLPLLKPYQGRYIYLATPPAMFHLITASLSNHGLIEKGNPHHRCAYEKPFGENGSAAHVLNDLLHEVIEEKQLYRVDHYLAKPIIQQLIKIRMQWATLGMESYWQSPKVTRIHLVAHEKVSILSRGKFYDGTGAIKDMVQSHLLETLALLMMDLPKRIDDVATIQQHKISLLKSLKPNMEQVVVGQYEGYQQELHVNPSSITETFAHLPLSSNLTRWKDTSITIETGKKLDEKRTSIDVYFHSGHRLQFQISPVVKVIIDQDWLTSLPLNLANHLKKLMLHPFATEDAYVTVFSDFFHGNQTLFPSNKEIEVTWALIDHIKQKPLLPIRYQSLKDLNRK
jgi:glucose-6-phosphate 1-dehydrogenase